MFNTKSITLATAARVTADGSSAAVDVSEFQGIAKAILTAGATEGADHTIAIKLQHCDTSGGSYVDAGVAFTTLTNAAASHQEITFNADNLKPFVKVAHDISGTSTPAGTFAVILVGTKQRS